MKTKTCSPLQKMGVKTSAAPRDAKPSSATGSAWELRLYVAGPTPKSVIARRNIEQFCKEHLAGRYNLEIVDLTRSPHLAQADHILAVPTLVRQRPSPIRKLIGTLANAGQILAALDLCAAGPNSFAKSS